MSVADRAATGPILIAYDGSDHARSAVEHAGIRLQPGPALVICVWTSIRHGAGAATLGAPASVVSVGAQKLDSAARERAEQLAAEGAELARRAGLDADSRAVEAPGAVWQGIIRCADELDAAVIVSGTRGRSEIAAAMLGSTAQGLLHHAHRPLFVVTSG